MPAADPDSERQKKGFDIGPIKFDVRFTKFECI